MSFKSLLLGFGLLSGQAYSFVHVSADQPKLPVDADSPVATFYWDGSAPEISKKDEFVDGIYQDLGDQDFFRTLLERALQKWHRIPGSYLELALEEDASSEIKSDDERNSIVVDSIESSTAAAFASPINRGQDGESEASKDIKIIHDCDITISNRKVEASTLFTTIVHELGHCIGLGHPHTSYLSVMSYSPFNRQSSLSLDDMAGVIFLYPEDDESPKELAYCGGVGDGRGRRGYDIIPFFCLVLLGFLKKRESL